MSNEKRIELVVFDWAGTTTDFGSQAPVHVFDKTFSDRGINFTKAEINAPMGMEKKAHIRSLLETARGTEMWQKVYNRSWTEEDVENIYREFENNLSGVVAKYSNLIPNVKETVEALRSADIKVGSTTGYTSEMMEFVTPVAKEQGYEPDCVITPDVTKHSRPTPFMIFECMRRLNVYPPKHVVKVGDTAMDILEGKNAGAWTVGVLKGSNLVGLSQEEYESMDAHKLAALNAEASEVYLENGADFVINDITELPNIIKHINELMK